MKTQVLIFSLFVLMFTSCSDTQPEQVYVDTNRLMQEFDYYTEFEKTYQKRFEQSKSVIDSIQFQLQLKANQFTASNTQPDEQFLREQQRLFQLKQQQDESLGVYYDQQMGKITQRLNTYIKAFGEKHQYPVILGANGQGVLLYADSTLEITDQVIDFVNQRYAGN